ncbi:MAG TPA: SET domain-containing protein-lysine N-methyltransferase [Caulobacteraceae bacterium]|nr:SET domain-containing protein-lysine N-methyltransferase [Caulobacteraceae bacterium]
MIVPPGCWLSERAAPRPSPIEGLGLFATAPISRGEIVIRLGGRVIDDDALARLEQPYSSVALDENAHLLIDPAHPVRYGNHGCDPNLWHLDAVTIAARRDVASGEELTIDYGTHSLSPSWAMACSCGSPLCRGRISGEDWRIERLQATYGRHWTPVLLRRIEALRR